MKFLIDNALSPLFARTLAEAGHDAKHVRDINLCHAPDEVIFDAAAEQGRIVVSADTDFGTILALRDARYPSVILLRGHESRRPKLQAQRLLPNLPDLAADLECGSLIVVERTRIRVRHLPMSGSRSKEP